MRRAGRSSRPGPRAFEAPHRASGRLPPTPHSYAAMSHFGEYRDSGPPPQNRSWGFSGPRRRGGSAESSRRGPPPLGARLGGGPVAEACDEPLAVVALDELGDHRARLLQRLEAVEIQAL